MTESKKIINYEQKDVVTEIAGKRYEIEPDTQSCRNPVIKEKIDDIDRARKLKKWKQSFSYYNLHPQKFKFGLKDLK